MTTYRYCQPVIPLQLLLCAVLGWLEREQRDVIAFLREENRALKRQLVGRRLRSNDAQRRRLAVLGQRLGRHVHGEFATLVTPDTILRWHRELVDRKWTSCCPKTRSGELFRTISAPELERRWARRFAGSGVPNLGPKTATVTPTSAMTAARRRRASASCRRAPRVTFDAREPLGAVPVIRSDTNGRLRSRRAWRSTTRTQPGHARSDDQRARDLFTLASNASRAATAPTSSRSTDGSRVGTRHGTTRNSHRASSVPEVFGNLLALRPQPIENGVHTR
jgi:hypothetical protein